MIKPVELTTLNDNFRSIFATETPLMPDLLNWPSPYADMADIKIMESGVLKPLKSLKAHKAPGLVFLLFVKSRRGTYSMLLGTMFSILSVHVSMAS